MVPAYMVALMLTALSAQLTSVSLVGKGLSLAVACLLDLVVTKIGLESLC